jgi:drug/metabolite transporter (DMT)-like permease
MNKQPKPAQAGQHKPQVPASPSARWMLPLALVVLTAIWGYSWVFAKQALFYAPPFAFAAERCLAAALALLAIVRLTGQPLSLPLPRQTLTIGLVQSAGFMAFQTWALVEGGPGKTAVLVFTMPIWTLLIAWPVLGERVRGTQWLAAISTLTGMVLIVEPWNMHTSLLSKALGIMAAMCWAAGSVLVKRLRARHAVNLLRLTAWQMLLGSVPLVLLALAVPERATNWTVSYIAILAFMSVVASAMGWWLWTFILDRIPAWEASLSVLGTPVLAIISSRVVTGEDFTAGELAGIVLIASGLALLSLLGWIASRRKAAAGA